MAGLKFDEHLTRDATTALAVRTEQGQAHFGGTGPKGMLCVQCIHWRINQGISPSYYSKASGGLLKPHPCRKFKELTGRIGKDVPYNAAACKYFELNPKPPAVASKKHRY